MRRKRNRKEGEDEEDEGGQESSPAEPLKKRPSSKKGKGKPARDLQKATGQVSQQLQHQKDPKEPWNCVFLVDGRPVGEGDSVLKSGNVRGGQVVDAIGKALLLPQDMKVWQEKRSRHMLENLKRDSVLVSLFVFTFCSSVHYVRIYLLKDCLLPLGCPRYIRSQQPIVGDRTPPPTIPRRS
jgi:hypothetical protein